MGLLLPGLLTGEGGGCAGGALMVRTRGIGADRSDVWARWTGVSRVGGPVAGRADTPGVYGSSSERIRMCDLSWTRQYVAESMIVDSAGRTKSFHSFVQVAICSFHQMSECQRQGKPVLSNMACIDCVVQGESPHCLVSVVCRGLTVGLIDGFNDAVTFAAGHGLESSFCGGVSILDTLTTCLN